jgi:hypothetical protein
LTTRSALFKGQAFLLIEAGEGEPLKKTVRKKRVIYQFHASDLAGLGLSGMDAACARWAGLFSYLAKRRRRIFRT